jgi:hypothetical protein
VSHRRSAVPVGSDPRSPGSLASVVESEERNEMPDTVHMEIDEASYRRFHRLALQVIADSPEGSEVYDDAVWLREYLDDQTDQGRAFGY